jgi:hypothetical protein
MSNELSAIMTTWFTKITSLAIVSFNWLNEEQLSG